MSARERAGQPRRYPSWLRRSFDLAVAGPALLLLLPVIALCAAAVRVSLGSPVLFRQRRTGLHGRIFVLLKFRTMALQPTQNGPALSDAARVTGLGRFLRRTSLDELPQLWNVLKGEMSIVGPRPLLPEYLPRYSTFQSRRHECNPGITGWAQVLGRNTLSWERRFELDVWYVDHRSFWLDLRILAMTFRTVLSGRGESEPAGEFPGTRTSNSA